MQHHRVPAEAIHAVSSNGCMGHKESTWDLHPLLHSRLRAADDTADGHLEGACEVGQGVQKTPDTVWALHLAPALISVQVHPVHGGACLQGKRALTLTSAIITAMPTTTEVANMSSHTALSKGCRGDAGPIVQKLRVVSGSSLNRGFGLDVGHGHNTCRTMLCPAPVPSRCVCGCCQAYNVFNYPA